MDVHSVMAQNGLSSVLLRRIGRGRSIFSRGLVPDHPPMSASQSVFNIRFGDIHENNAFYHYQCKIRNGQNYALISQYGSCFFLSQLNCIATALFFQLLVTTTPEQAYFPKIPCQILIRRHFRCDSKPNNKITEMFSPAPLTKHSGHHNFMSFPFIEIPHWQPFCSFYDRASSCSLSCAKCQRSIVSLWHSVNPWKGLCIIVSAIS